jgi:hypothetical protein
LKNSQAVEDRVNMISTAVYGSMVGMVVVVASLLVLPILTNVDLTRDHFMLPFIHLPARVPATLRSTAERRLRDVRASEVDDEGDDSTSDADQDVDSDSDGTGAESESTKNDNTAYWEQLAKADGKRGSTKQKMRIGTNTSINSPSIAPLAAPLRQYRKSFRSLFQLVFRFVLPLFVVFLFFTVIFAQTASTLRFTHITQAFAVVADQRTVELREIPMLIRGLLSMRGTRTQIAPSANVLLELMDSVQYHHNLLTFVGVPTDDAVSVVSTTDIFTRLEIDASDLGWLEQALFGDSCKFMQRYAVAEGFTYDRCANFHEGILTMGMHGSLMNFLSVARGLVVKRANADVPAEDGMGVLVLGNLTQPYSWVEQLNSQDLKDLFVYSNDYLVQGFDGYASVFRMYTTRSLTRMQLFLVAFVSSFLVVFMIYQFMVYVPLVYKTNTEINNERFVVLLLPPAVLKAVPALQAMVTEMLRSAESRFGAA